MKWTVGKKISSGFGLVLAIVFVVGAVSYSATTQLIAAADARKEAFRGLIKVQRVLTQLNAVEVGQRSYILTGAEAYLQAYETATASLERELRELRELTRDARERQRLDVITPIVKDRLDLARDTVSVYRTKGPDAAQEVVQSGRGNALSENIGEHIAELRSEKEKVLEEHTEQARADAENAKRTIIVGTLSALALAAIIAFLLTRNIAAPLQNLTAVAERITAGDLNVDSNVEKRTDEVGVLAHTFQRMTQSLRVMADAAERIAAGDLRSAVQPQSAADVLGNAFARMAADLREQIRALNDGANAVTSAASEIVATTSQLAASATQSAAAVSETTTTVEEVRQTAEVASDKAKHVSDSAQKAAQVSQSGRKSTEELTSAMDRIRQQMDSIAGSMMRLSEQGQAIGQIIATVEDLSAQSNLLAVNAAIEAAKAGEHGKGFGVVAQEVRSLAEQSRDATTQVRTILGEIQKATAAAVMLTEQGMKAVEGGTRQSSVAAQSIHALSASVTEAAQAATQIAASSQQQLIGVDQVAGAMQSIREASTQNVESAQQLESAAVNLNELGHRLQQMVERYQS